MPPPSSSSLPSTSLPLGHPLPLDEHACSVSLPTWCSVVGYEEGCPSITDKLACGYPRFVYHPYVIQLMEAVLETDKQKSQIEGEFDCIVLPSRNSAIRCHDFLVKACGYHDGKAVSPRLVNSFATVHQMIGESRVKLFSMDNALDVTTRGENDEDADVGVYNPKSPIRVLDIDIMGVHAVVFPAQTVFAIEAKSYWQHTGEVLSSRRAEATLAKLGLCSKCDLDERKQGLKRVTSSFYNHDNDNDDDNDKQRNAEGWSTCPHTQQPHLALFPSEVKNMATTVDCFRGIQERIGSIVGIPSSCVFLTPSGMASIYTALRSARRKRLSHKPSSHGGTAIVYGFPYLDTLKMCSRSELVPDGVEFFGHGNDADLQSLERLLKKRALENDGDAGVSVLITEFPSNPLLHCPNLHKLRALADEYGFALVVDDTIGNFANLDLVNSGLADAVCTSLTKLFNGRGDAMAGSVIVNPHTDIGRWMEQDLKLHHVDHEGLWEGDAVAVYSNSEDFLERSHKINQTTEALADWLKEREEIAAIYYPKYTCPEGYNAIIRKDDCGGKHKAGYGGLFSIILDHHVCDRSFYDKINVSKGPSLGTNFSLACPYTLLAHYHELDFAMSYDVQPNLIRFAIGLEDLDEMKKKFEVAFQDSRLHPKLPRSQSKGKIQTTTISREYHTCSNTLWNGGVMASASIIGTSKFTNGGRGGFYNMVPFTSSFGTRKFGTQIKETKSDGLDLTWMGQNVVGNKCAKLPIKRFVRSTLFAILRK